MRFPGSRNPKHYFPVTRKATRVDLDAEGEPQRWYVVGLDEVIVDLEVYGPRALGEQLGFAVGESVQLDAASHAQLLERLAAEGLEIRSWAAGGTVANSLNNYTHLSGEPAVLLGAIQETIRHGDPAWAYVAQTPKALNLDHLTPLAGPIGSAITYVSDDGERSFGVGPGVAGDYSPEDVPIDVVEGAAMVMTSLYCLRPTTRPIAHAARRMMRVARDAGVPVAFGLGTAGLVRELRDVVQEVLREYVTVAAMNLQEATALTGETDALLAAEKVLDLVDVVIVTEGPRGLTVGGWTDESTKRETREAVRSGAIPDFNRWEYSRLFRRDDCPNPVRIYSHTHPYRGGPDRLANTNGAGDAALAALLHDLAANRYHGETVPNSEKHAGHIEPLSYSSLSRIAQYSNRVAYEVLRACSPRLDGPVGSDEA